MYRIKKNKMVKMAGTVLPKDKGLWTSEVMKSLISQHPYVDMKKIKVEFVRTDPDSGDAFGKITLGGKAVAPFFIRKDDKTKKMELDPIDVIYDGASFRALNDNSLAEILDGKIGDVSSKQQERPNDYVGHLTGDTTPLEWNYTGSGFSGGRTVSAGCGLLSSVVRNMHQVEQLHNLLGRYRGIASKAEVLGLSDSLEELGYGLAEEIPTDDAHIAVISRSGTEFKVKFSNGDQRMCSLKDLKWMLGSDFMHIQRLIQQRGWATVRDLPVMKNVEAPSFDTTPAPIKSGGRYMIHTGGELDGPAKEFLVFEKIMGYDGEVRNEQKILCPISLNYSKGKQFSGHMLGRIETELPVGTIEPGVKGFYVHEAWGTAQATPNITILQIIDNIDGSRNIIAEDEYTNTRIGLIPLPNILRPQRIPIRHRPDHMPTFSYYIPGHMTFVAVNEHITIPEHGAVNLMDKVAHIHKSAGKYHITGYTKDGYIGQSFDQDDFRLKLASFGVDDDTIERVEIGDLKKLYNLQSVLPEEEEVKVAKWEVPEYMKLAAEEALQAVEESDDVNDPQSIDAVLSLQFISEENMRDLLGSENLFMEVEDKIARLLLASRQGEKSINEPGVARALKGIGVARKALKSLAIELDDREDS